MSLRRAGAPRLIDWTGERAVPWAPNVQVIYEHYHRYLWAQPLVSGRRVLELASGEGFGAAFLAETAASVTGIDIDEPTVNHARLNYGSDAVTFDIGSALDLSRYADASFDAVVAFEMIEHVDDAEQLLREIARVLEPGGLLLVSSPDRRIYTEATGQHNPFHTKEFDEDEFREILGTHFGHVRMFGQRAMTGSKIESLDGESETGARPLNVRIARSGDEWVQAGQASAMYLIAACSTAELPAIPDDSTLSDHDLGLMREAEARLGAQLNEAAERHRRAAVSLDALVSGLGLDPDDAAQMDPGALAQRAAEIRAREQALRHTEDELRQRAEHAEAARAALSERLVRQARDTDAAIRAKGDSETQYAELELRTADERRRLQRVEESVAWGIFQRVRGKVYGAIGGPTSIRGRVLQKLMRGVGRVARRGPAVAPAAAEALDTPIEPRIALPGFDMPEVSIVIPVHSQAELTERCLRAILWATADVEYEVILVDDTADADTKALLAATSGAVILENAENLGYLRSVNRGSAAARGRYLVHLNNDTEPQPGWLRALIDRAESAPDIGVVVCKLLYPDGTLQEAGGIVWRDGNGWNVGRGGDATLPDYNYVREVDYGSAAAMLVRRELWEQVDGYDERFVPGYYEDTDLCFSARAHGWRVMYEPRAVVIHVEGASMGTDISSGGKHHQELNRVAFVEKWSKALADQYPGPGDGRLGLAADRGSGPHVLVIDHRMPTPDRDSGSLRMWHLLSNLIDLGCRVTFLPDDHAPMAPYTERLQGMGVRVLYGAVDFGAYLAGDGSRTALAIVCRPYVAPRYVHMLREFVPHTLIAYDTVDLHYVREERRASLEGNSDLAKASGLRELELALARACDVTLTVTDAEAQQLRQDAPGVALAVVPNANVIWEDVPGREHRDGLVFVGGFEHPPNTDAATYLVRRVMPIVWRRMPDLHVTIVGGSAPHEVTRLAGPRVDVAGWVEDLDPLLRSSLALAAPLRYGAGMKGKVTQALSAGLPVITTSVGAEGLAAADGEHMLIGETAEELAAKILELCGDGALWQQLSDNGRELIRDIASPEVQRRALGELVARALPTGDLLESPR